MIGFVVLFVVPMMIITSFLIGSYALRRMNQIYYPDKIISTAQCWSLSIYHAVIDILLFFICVYAADSPRIIFLMAVILAIFASLVINAMAAARVLGELSKPAFIMSAVLFVDILPLGLYVYLNFFCSMD